MKKPKERLYRVMHEYIAITPHNDSWSKAYADEKEHLMSILPNELIKRIEHFGSTAVPGIAAKPIVDMLVEVTSLAEVRRAIVPILKSEGYEYFWRPTQGNDMPPFYAWFIKRNSSGTRTHHIHMVEKGFEQWDTLFFRDYLIEHPEVAKAYELLKNKLADQFPNDRMAYTQGKTDFIVSITQQAKEYFRKKEKVLD